MAKSELGVYFFAGTLLNAAWLGGYIGLCAIARSSLWLAAGVAIAIAGLALVCGCFCLFATRDIAKPSPQLVTLFVVVYSSATFAGLLGGAYYQEFWYYSSLPAIKDVNVNDVVEMTQYDENDVRLFRFIPETMVNTNLGYGYGAACAAPILVPPYRNDSQGRIQVKFWAIGASCCSGTRMSCESWRSTGLVGIVPRQQVEGTKEAANRALLNYNSLVQDPNPVYVAWMSESQVTTKADKALVAGQIIIGLHFPLWFVWSFPVLLILCWWRC
jgi:hypothetical protein